MRKGNALLLAVLMLIIAGCSTVREESAETTAPTDTVETHGVYSEQTDTQPAEDSTENIAETTEPPEGCIYCGAWAPDLPFTEEGVCQGCYGKLTDGGGLCNTCGLPYGMDEGFEALCYSCQDKYGPKCSVCGTDCTYRGTIDGMCDDCYYRCGLCGSIAYSGGEWIDGVYTCPACVEEHSESACFWCGAECAGDGIWVDELYCCRDCGTPKPCDWCGTPYYFWKMFEGTCFDCNDPSGGAADDIYCGSCGSWSDCDYGYGLCYDCFCIKEYGNCVLCGAQRTGNYSDGLCVDCWYDHLVMCPECYWSIIDLTNSQAEFVCPGCGHEFTR